MNRVGIAFATVAAALGLYAPAPATADVGGVWATTLEATQGFDHLSAFPNGVFYAQYLNTYMKSTDYGKTWTPMTRPPRQSEGSPGIRFATPTIGWSVVGGGVGVEDTTTDYKAEIAKCGDLAELHRTTDGGATWQPVCVPRTRLLDDPYFGVSGSPLAVGRDGRTAMLVGQDISNREPSPKCSEDHGVIATTRDGGAHWTRAALPTGWMDGFRSQVYDANTMVHLAYKFRPYGDDGECIGDVTGLFLTRDGGKTWRRVHTCGAPDLCTSVAMVTPSRILLGRNDGTTLVSNDGGTTWNPGQRLFDLQWQPGIDSGNVDRHMFWAQAMSFADATHGFASTRGSGTWRTDNGGKTWTQERSQECEYFLWGIGEIAAGSPTTAITGGPHLISTRIDTPAPQVGCTPALPGNVPLDASVWQSGSQAISVTGLMRRL